MAQLLPLSTNLRLFSSAAAASFYYWNQYHIYVSAHASIRRTVSPVNSRCNGVICYVLTLIITYACKLYEEVIVIVQRTSFLTPSNLPPSCTRLGVSAFLHFLFDLADQGRRKSTDTLSDDIARGTRVSRTSMITTRQYSFAGDKNRGPLAASCQGGFRHCRYCSSSPGCCKSSLCFQPRPVRSHQSGPGTCG